MNLINGIETDFRFAGIDKFDVNNGNGVGATLFVQGCVPPLQRLPQPIYMG